jgi:hypothetical protein
MVNEVFIEFSGDDRQVGKQASAFKSNRCRFHFRLNPGDLKNPYLPGSQFPNGE